MKQIFQAMAGLAAAVMLSTMSGAALAQEWRHQAPQTDMDGSPFFFAFLNKGKYPDRGDGNGITLIRDPLKESLKPDGKCSFDDCTFKVIIDGAFPAQGDKVSVLFSNGHQMNWQHGRGVVFLNNHARFSIGRNNDFYDNMRQSGWVDIAYGGRSHRFSLTGSNAAMDAIIPYLKGQ